MFVVEIMPITKTSMQGGSETLTYYTSAHVEPGFLVEAPLRRSYITGVVISVTALETQKSSIKNASYGLKKIHKVIGPSTIHTAVFETAKSVANWYATNVGSITAGIIPKELLATVKKSKNKTEETENKKDGTKNQVLVLQATPEARMSIYKTRIRESFARGQSIIIVTPTRERARALFAELSRGIEQFSGSIDSTHSIKKQQALFNLVYTTDHGLLLVGTPHILALYHDLVKTIVIEDEAHDAYYTVSRPLIDYRIVAENMAQITGATLVLGGSLLRAETLEKFWAHEYGRVEPIDMRFPKLAEIKVVDRTLEEKFSIFSPPLVKTISEIGNRNEHVILFCIRKGIAPITVCHDCGTPVGCERCTAPLTLYKKKGQTIYGCNRCNHIETTTRYCAVCKSWNLVPIGIGTEHVYEKATELVAGTVPVYLLDSTTVKSEKAMYETLDEFYKKPAGVIVCNEPILPYITNKVDKVVVVSIDTLFGLPHARVNETIVRILTTLDALARKPLIIQTKNPTEYILEEIKTGSLITLYKDEVTDRKMMDYPPYGVIVKVSIVENKERTKKARAEFMAMFAQWNPVLTTTMVSKIKEKYRTVMVINLKLNEWNPDIQNIVRTLGPAYTVEINPKTLW